MLNIPMERMALKKWLKARKISIKAFAQLIKRDRSYVHMMISGTIPSKKVMRRIAEVTNEEISHTEDLSDGESNLHEN